MKYDITQAEKDNRRLFETGRDALSEASSSEAGYLSGVQGLNLRGQRANQSLRDLENNKNNQYRLQESQVRGNMGEQYAAELRREQIYGQQADAGRRAFAGQAAQDISNVSQRNVKGDNAATRDAGLQGLLQGSYGDLGELEAAIAAFKTTNN